MNKAWMVWPENPAVSVLVLAVRARGEAGYPI